MEHSTSFQFKALYHQLGIINEDTEEVWFTLHGYGQLSKYFIRKFRSIANDKRVIVAPGGLSRFYLEGFDGRVGATWMTSEERLLDIENYIHYLQSVYEEVKRKLGDKPVKVHFLGFSQGAATVVRWLEKHEDPFERLILWAGSFPHDMDFPVIGHKLADKRVVMVRGDQDPFVTEEVKQRQLEVINKLGLPIKHVSFEGVHDIDTPTLENLTS